MSTVEYVGLMDCIEMIELGRFDGDLKEIKEAVAGREREMTAAWRDAIKPGFRVQLIKNISPKYLAGAAGTVERVEGKRFVVKLDFPRHGRNRTWHTANCYAQHLEPYEEDE